VGGDLVDRDGRTVAPGRTASAVLGPPWIDLGARSRGFRGRACGGLVCGRRITTMETADEARRSSSRPTAADVYDGGLTARAIVVMRVTPFTRMVGRGRVPP